MYCESTISHIDFAHVEHIKPKALFSDLEFVWANLGYACPKCNNAKSDKYSDAAPSLDPYAEDPSEHVFAAGALVFTRNGSERGEITIHHVELNRPELIEKRQEKLAEVEKALLACHRCTSPELRVIAMGELQNEGKSDREYSMCTKAMLAAHAG
jgi:hypothetical protein